MANTYWSELLSTVRPAIQSICYSKSNFFYEKFYNILNKTLCRLSNQNIHIHDRDIWAQNLMHVNVSYSADCVPSGIDAETRSHCTL